MNTDCLCVKIDKLGLHDKYANAYFYTRNGKNVTDEKWHSQVRCKVN